MNITKNLTTKMERMFQDDLRFTKGASHCHTQNSVDDGFQSEEAVCRRALELGASVAFISDHGTAMGWDDFDDAAKRVGIKPVFGVEAYYKDHLNRSHLVLYAMNNNGLKKINKAMSMGEVSTEFSGTYTCLTDETLEYLRGGDVIATSACIQGPLGSIILFNNRINEKIEKLEDEINEFADSISMHEEMTRVFEEANERFSIAKAEVSEAKAAAKKSFTGKQKQVDGMKKKLDKAIAAFDKFIEDGKETSAKSVRVALAQLEVNVESPDDFQDGIEEAQMKYNQRSAMIKAEIAKTEELAKTVEERTAAMEKAKEERAAAKAELDAVSKDVAKVETKKEKINELVAQKLTQEQSQELYETRLKKMLEVFGKNFFIEVQYHGIEAEKTIYPWVAKVARKHKIPIIAANDAHVTYNSENEFKGRQIRRSCRFKKWETEIEGDEELYIKTDRELALALYQILPEDVVIEAMTNVAKVVDMCDATIDKESHAPKAKGVENVREEMVRLARENITKKYGDSWGKMHEERFEYEVNIIDSMGFSDYFVITWDILNVARKIGGLSYEKLDELKSIMTTMTMDELMSFLDEFSTEINLSVGLGRGSGAGSIVCYLLGITNIDPFKYDLLFEREKDCVH